MNTNRLYRSVAAMATVAMLVIPGSALAAARVDPVNAAPSPARASSTAYFTMKETQSERADAASLRAARRVRSVSSAKASDAFTRYFDFKARQAQSIMGE